MAFSKKLKFWKRKTNAKKEKDIRDLEQQLEEERRRRLDVEEQLQEVKAEKDKAIQKLEQQLLEEEKRRHYEEEQKAEMEKAIKDLQDELGAERRRNLEEQQTLLENLHKAETKIEEMKAKQLAHNLQPAANCIEPQQGHLGETEGNVARCGSGHEGKSCVNDFAFISVLGEGGFGKVLLAQCKSPGKPHYKEEYYAIKVLKKYDIKEEGLVELVMEEKKILKLVRAHPFIVSLYSCFQTEAHLFFIMELAHGGNLRDQLDKVQKYGEPTAAFYAAEITLALQFLHAKGIVHRDLKVENILVDKEGHIRLSDFGIAKSGLRGVKKLTTYCGTPECVSPEMAQQLAYRHEVDWWGLGIIIYEMLVGYQPFWPHDDLTVMECIIHDDVRYPQWLSKEALSIMEGHFIRLMDIACMEAVNDLTRGSV